MILSIALLMASTVEAQEATEAAEAGTEAAEASTIEVAEVGETSLAYEDKSPPEEGDPDCLTNVYCKVVKGMLWIEGTIGPAKFNATKFRTLNLLEDFGGNLSPSVVVKGPEFGAAIGAQFDIFSIGARFKYANFDPFDLMTVGLDFGFLMKMVPFVHPYARFGLYYATTRNGTVIPVLDQLLDDPKTQGGGASLGVGVRVPVIKWMSIAIGVDYTFIGLYVKGDVINPAPGDDEEFANGTIGGEVSGTFALTFHPI
jgi:hypothetical protein